MADLLTKALSCDATQFFALDLDLWREEEQNGFLVVVVPGGVLERCDCYGTLWT